MTLPERSADSIRPVSDDLSFERRVLNQLESQDAQLDAIEKLLTKGDQRMATIEWAAKDLASAVHRQNGRIGKLEAWRQTQDLIAAREEGRVEARRETVLSRSQLAFVAAAASAVPTVVAAALAVREFLQ